jgi:hypothetical protein
MTAILVKHGTYRNAPVINTKFTLVKGYQVGKKGAYVTVRNEGHFPVDIDAIKIKIDNINSIQYLNGDQMSTSVIDESTARMQADYDAQPVESDVEAMNRIAARFEVLDQMSKAAIAGDIRAMIVTGPPGVGKSHGIIQQMEKASLFDKIAQRTPRFEIVKGAVSGIGLFATLYKFSDPKNVLVFDDCDVFSDPDALNVLKGALDSGKKRRISWNKDSRLLRDEGVPNSFDFNGSIIFITNLSFDDQRSKKIQAHVDALQSRCHFLDLTIDSMRDKMLRIKQVHRDADGGLFADYSFSADAGDEILEFMESNMNRLREISLRMALKIADLIKVSPNSWKMLTEATCMKRG